MDISVFVDRMIAGLKPAASDHLKIEAVTNKNKTVSINMTYYNRLYVAEPVTAMFTRYNEKDDTLYFRTIFDKQLKESAIPFEIKSDGQYYASASNFFDNFDFSKIDRFIYPLFQFDSMGCCGKFNECSDAGECVHDDLIYAGCCMYRKNLEAGKIFYGKNRNNNSEANMNPVYNINDDNTVELIEKTKIEKAYTENDEGKIPENYTVIDVETTGFDFTYDSIIEVSAVKVRNTVVADSFTTLLKPPKRYDDVYVDDFIIKLTGITNDMLDNAPEPKDVLPEFIKFVGDDIVVGHNVNFDIKFLKSLILKSLSEVFSVYYIDTLQISRKLFPKLEHHRLSDTASACSVLYENAHRSLSDCNITYACFEAMRDMIYSRYGTYENFYNTTRYVHHKHKIDCSEIVPENDSFNEDHPFYNKTVVFTGDLERITRKEAMQLVVNAGGLISDNVTRKTNYLVVGSFDFIKSVKGNKSTKMKKAEELILGGYDLKIISDKTFFELI